MKKKLLVVMSLIGMTISTLFAGCDKQETVAQATETANAEGEGVEYQWNFVKKTTGIDDLKQECDMKGEITELEYETPLYASNPEETGTKKLWVYTPYGYDENQQYDILYLMHGGGENEDYWLAGERWGPTTRFKRFVRATRARQH